jgi:hypothetical protein
MLGPPREPYWYKLARDRHLGLRKLGLTVPDRGSRDTAA